MMQANPMDDLLLKYSEFLTGTKGRSANTIRIYMNDLQPFRQFIQKEDLNLCNFNRQSLRKYLAWLATSASKKGTGYARVSMARMLVALRSFYSFLERNGTIEKNPIPKSKTLQIKVKKHLPVFLGLKDMEPLIRQQRSESVTKLYWNYYTLQAFGFLNWRIQIYLVWI